MMNELEKIFKQKIGPAAEDRNPRRDQEPPSTIYLLADVATPLYKLSCMYCKRTIADAKGRIDTVVQTPLPLEDFGNVVQIKCKQCGQLWRVITT